MNAFTPATLAQRWGCSPAHVYSLVKSGKLPAFRLGAKLLRIPTQAVEDFECPTIQSDGSRADLSLSTGEKESGTVTRLEPVTRARLTALRRESTQNSQG